MEKEMHHNYDLDMAVEHLKDEIAGISAYKKSISKTTDPTLANIFREAVVAERNHANAIMSWVGIHMKDALK